MSRILDWVSQVDKARIPGDVLTRLDTLESNANQAISSDVSFEALEDATEDFGIIRNGGLFFGVGDPFDLTTSPTGVFIGYPPIVIGGIDFNEIGFNAGTLQFGLSAVDGTGVFAGGAAVLNSLGAIFTGINYFVRFNSVNAGNNRTLEFGTTLPTGATVQAGYISWYDSTAVANLQTNGDFELGALTDWTSATNGGTWSAQQTVVHGGAWAAKLNNTQAIVSNLQVNGDFELGNLNNWTGAGTGTWLADTYANALFNAPSGYGTYLGRFEGTASQTGTLTTSLVAGGPRLSVTAGVTYQVFVPATSNDPTRYSTKQVLVKWYTAVSGGALISTATNTLVTGTVQGGGAANYVLNAFNLVAPATALGAEIVINLVRDSSAGDRKSVV